MADLDDLIPLFPEETEAAIRERFDVVANEGLPTTSPLYRDTRVGSMFFVCTQSSVREFARAYDRLSTEVIAAASPLYAWGFYLDDHGAVVDLGRLAATPADGVVRFFAPPETFVPPGTTVAVDPLLPGDPAPSYGTTAGGTVPADGTYVDLPVVATSPGSVGNVSPNAVTTLLSAAGGVTGVNNLAPIEGGTDPETDEQFRPRILDRYKGQGAGNERDYRGWALEFPGVGLATVIPLFRGPGTVLVIARTAIGGPVSTATVDGLQANLDPLSFQTALTAAVTANPTTLPVVTTNGATVAPGVVRVEDDVYNYTGKTATSFTGVTGGTMIHASGAAVTQGGLGAGRAPIGAHVTVRTGTTLNITISATVEPEDDFSVNPSPGKFTLYGSVLAALDRYVRSVEPGGEIVFAQVIGKIAGVTGVHDVKDVLIDGAALNVPVPALPARIPVLTSLVLTQGSF